VRGRADARALLAAGFLAGCLPALVLPGARVALPPLLLLPLFPLAWLGMGRLVEAALGLRTGFLTQLGLGAGALHTFLLLAGLCGGYRSWIAWPLLAGLACAGCLDLWRRPPKPAPCAGVAVACWSLLGLLAGLMTLVTVVPPMDPDAMTYHLALPEAWAAAGRFVHVPTLHYSYMPLGAEQGFLLARLLLPGSAFAGWALAGGVHLLYGLLLAGAAGRLLGGTCEAGPARPLASLLVFALPATLLVSGLPYNDAYLSALLLLALVEGLRWAGEPSARRAMVAGMLFGFALGAKYTALLAAPALLAAALVVAGRGPGRERWVRGLLAAGAAALVVWLPWILKTWWATGNPVYPAAFSLLGGAPEGFAAWDAAAAAENAATAGHGAGLHPLRWLSAPLELWRDPEAFGVLPRVGPAALLVVPFLAWALLARNARRLRGPAVAALLLYLTWSLVARNARYLLPCLGIGLALAAWGIVRLARMRPATGRTGAILVPTVLSLLVAGVLAWNLAIAADIFTRLLAPGRFLTGAESAQDYVVARRPYAACLLQAARELPAGAEVLFLGETRALYLERRALVGGPADPSPLLWLERKTGAPGLVEAVRRSGVTHVLAKPRGVLDLQRDHNRYRGREAEALALLRWLEEEAEPVAACGDARLYRLP